MTAVSLTPTLRQTGRRWRFAVGIAVVVVLIALVTLLTQGAFAGHDEFEPDNAAPLGAEALVSVLGEHGVAVTVADRLAAAESAGAGGTVFVDDRQGLLSARQWAALAASTRDLVVADPSTAALQALSPGVLQAGMPSSATVAAGCSLPLATRASGMALTGATSSLRLVDPPATLCFRDDDDAGQLVSTTLGSTDVLLLASVQPFENGSITSSGNAAVALGALGAHAELTWYVPSALDAATTASPTLQDLTPTWVTPFMGFMLLAGLAAVFWQGRRLGPLAIERLPVVVRSRETVDGRARLYQRSGARLRAADALRIGAIGRIARRLGLARQASVEDVVLGVAALLRMRTEGIRAALLETVPTDDRGLVSLSDDLARLEAAVAAAVLPGAAPAPPGSIPAPDAPVDRGAADAAHAAGAPGAAGAPAPNQDSPAPNQDPGS